LKRSLRPNDQVSQRVAQIAQAKRYPSHVPRRSSFRDDLRSIKAAVDSLSRTPLSSISENLRNTFGSFYGGHSSTATIETSIDLPSAIQSLLSQLPSSYGPRFDFDAAFIFALAADWNPSLELPKMTVPKHQGEWGFSELPLPTDDRERVPIVRVFHFPGQDSLEDIDLLAYPWLAHEVAHCLLFLHSTLFPSHFSPRLECILRALSLKGIADRGQARTVSRAGIEDMKRYWTPSHNQGNWAHEIAIDTIALWTCGPAYLGAFLDQVERANLDLFQVSTVHPPYSVRTLAILYACNLLKLDAYASPLRDFSMTLAQRYPNNLIRLAPDELIAAAVEAGLAVCEALKIRDWRYFDASGPGAPIPGTRELGTSLLLDAWRVRSQGDEESYSSWEREVISSFAAELAATQ
jgi:hypothetical protein